MSAQPAWSARNLPNIVRRVRLRAMSPGDTGEFFVRADEPAKVGRKSREQLLSELEVLEVQFEASREARQVLT